QNFSGTQTLQVQGISTERDGDSLTSEPVHLSFQVSPSVDAIANDGNLDLDEDVASDLNLHIVHQNGDEDETLGDVWINVDDLNEPHFSILLTGAALSTDEAESGEDHAGNCVSVAGADVPNMQVLGGEHLDKDLGSFGFLYEVIDNQYGDSAAGAEGV